MEKKKAISDMFGTKFIQLMKAKWSVFVGAIWKPLRDSFQRGYEYGYENEVLKQNQKRIEANEKHIKDLNALYERTKQRATEIEKTRQHNIPSNVNDPVCEMDFFIGNNRPVRVQMSYPFWGSLQDSHAGSWNALLHFVDVEIERRNTEGD